MSNLYPDYNHLHLLWITIRRQMLFGCCMLSAFQQGAQTLPELPNTSSIETCFPDTVGYAVITVGPAGRDYNDLQMAINAADPGSILVLDAGATFNGSFYLPEKTGNGWIIITSSAMNLLPAQGVRVRPDAITGDSGFPDQKSAMPKIISINLSGLPCFRTNASAHHYRFTGLEISVDNAVQNSYGLLFFGDAGSAQNSSAKLPHHLIVDRCYVHGHSNATIMKGGVLLNCADAAVVDSHISDFHSIGFDTYAIAGTNGPGPFKILNNYLEAAGENILFGGAAPAIPGLVPSDIEVRDNYFFKPFSWRMGHPDFAGKHWTIKNLFELKTGRRVLLDGNILENAWADLPIGQSGYAILLTVRSESGAAPQADVSDITITNNIIRHAGAGMSISGHDSPALSKQSKRILISNNLFDDINGTDYGDGNVNGPNDGVFLKIGDPSDVLIDHNTVFQSGAITWAYDTTLNIAIVNNIFHCFVSDGGYQGIYGPGFAQGGNGPMGAFFPGITDANRHFHKNILIGGSAAKYSNYSNQSQNFFPAVPAGVQFLDYPNGASDYHLYALGSGSAYKNTATNGKDPGVDFAQLDTALAWFAGCAPFITKARYPLEKNIRIGIDPSNGTITISGSEALENGVLTLYNAIGQETCVFSHLSGQNIGLPASEIPAGIYLANLSESGKTVSRAKLAAGRF